MTRSIILNDIEFTTYFAKQLERAPTEIKQAFKDALQLFLVNPHHASLHNHPLRERYGGQRSISVTPDWRAVFREVSTGSGTKYVFRALGTHKQLYGA